jgi:hypothetical protein
MAPDDGYELLVTRRHAGQRYSELCAGFAAPCDPGTPYEGMTAEQAVAFTEFYDADLAWESFKAATGTLMESP